MIFLTLTTAQARKLIEETGDSDVIDQICAQFLADEKLIDIIDEPRTVIFRDEGDGVRMAAVSYTNVAAADAAWEKFMAITQRQLPRLL